MHKRSLQFIVVLLLIYQCGCRSLQSTPSLPAQNNVQLDQLIVYSDFKLPRHHRLLGELNALRTDLSNKLNIPVSDESIHVYLFEDSKQFAEFMQKKYPTLPPRRAFFVETDTKLSIYAYWGDRIAEDLRHETTHGYLHAVIPNIPLWIDEGIAEYFEVSRGHRGISQTHISNLLKRHYAGKWKPDLARLEKLDSIETMLQVDYAESWAWIQMLLEVKPESRQLVIDYLHQLRNNATASPLSLEIKKMFPRPESMLIAYLEAKSSKKKK